jgi:uncharacterized membrane protein HdeD (DUF308 family)
LIFVETGYRLACTEQADTESVRERERAMLVLGVVLLLLGLLLKVSILWTIGIIVLIIGAVLFILGSVGRPVGGRRHYW